MPITNTNILFLLLILTSFGGLEAKNDLAERSEGQLYTQTAANLAAQVTFSHQDHEHFAPLNIKAKVLNSTRNTLIV